MNILKNSSPALFVLFFSFSFSLFAAQPITEIPVLIDNPTTYDVELWLGDEDAKRNEQNGFHNHLFVQAGESINYTILLQKPISLQEDSVRAIAYWTEINDIVTDDESDAGINEQESSLPVDARNKVHLVLQVERIYPEDEDDLFEPFDVISINHK